MKDILWTIYLAITILLSITLIAGFVTKNDKYSFQLAIAISILWAIWYMYFLH